MLRPKLQWFTSSPKPKHDKGKMNAKNLKTYKMFKSNPGKTPVIIVDLLTFLTTINSNKIEIYLGGRYENFNKRPIKLFSKLKALGVDLIFFSDGPAQDEKILTCVERRNDAYIKSVAILDKIYSAPDLHTIEDNGEDLPNLMPVVQNLKLIAQSFGEYHISNLNECDLEIAALATKMNALAILSNDTDFLIYEGDWKYWSSTNIEIDTLKTIQYNREALRKDLSLSSKQMPILAMLGGNDIIKYDTVLPFHKRVIRNYNKFRSLANIIRRTQSSSFRLSEEEIQTYADMIFNDYERRLGAHLIRLSIRSYDYSSLQTFYKNDLLTRLSKDRNFPFAIISGKKTFIYLSYFDLRCKDLMRYHDLEIPIKKKQMGILLKHLNNNRITRMIYLRRSHDESYEQCEVAPEYPKMTVPPILELLYTSYGSNKALDDVRLELLCWQISSKLNKNHILRLPKDNLINVLIIFYLFEKKQISIDEADCLLLSNKINNIEKDNNLLDFDKVRKIDQRDARLAFLFPRLQICISNCFEAIGLKEFCCLITFDGLYFHCLRKIWNKNLDLKMKLLDSCKDLRIYHELLC